ncbi:membrane-bound PQQ-dependent dehydrogenase, glucose/quinate/shikimate family [Raoultella terrigena]|uniref:Membrane-bound PQQ-dependent dehydrogenase, glucose/quinate/shikimate family n=1 Tax=Raoultella terrigena TaxID=577 RepID=A0A4U9CS58_RAOTE|nr:membrane-bound PQQ-dependent dehydrogenase, glucose/quinate/shikimate family [Raoultella terrigena]
MTTGHAPRGFPRILKWLLAGLMLIIGLAIGIPGIKLATLGGSLYFSLMGLAMVIASVLIFRNRRSGILLYAAGVCRVHYLGHQRCRMDLLAAVLAPVCLRRAGASFGPRLALLVG